jgi:hypothetical protein
MKKSLKTPKLTKVQIEEGHVIIEICEWMIQNGGKPPNKNSKDPVEMKLGLRLVQMRQTRLGKNKRKFNPVFDGIVKKYGFETLFETRSRQAQVEESLRKVIAWMKEHNKSPNKNSKKDPVEKKIGEILSSIRQSKTKKSHRVFYPTLEAIATEEGFPDLFKKQRKTVTAKIVKKAVKKVGVSKIEKTAVERLTENVKVGDEKTTA